MTTMKTDYAPVNGLQMYYEIHGEGHPLILLHGAFSAIGTSFGAFVPTLAKTHQVIGVDLQSHGHTADIDRPLTIENMAEDVVALMDYLGIPKADLFGYSMGAGVAAQITVQHPDRVRKLIAASLGFNKDAFHPSLTATMTELKPEYLIGTPWQLEYASIAPRPEDFPKLVKQVMYMNTHVPNWTTDDIQAIKTPTLLILGDSDIVRPEHAVEVFRLWGGGVSGDIDGLPASQLAILPSTSHTMVVARSNVLLPMIEEFLNAPMPENK